MAELGYDFCMTNVRMYIKKGYGGVGVRMYAYAHKVVGVRFFVYVCIFLALFDSLQCHAILLFFVFCVFCVWRVITRSNLGFWWSSRLLMARERSY